MENVLEVRDLTVRFGRDAVIRGLSFDVPAGSALAIIGPNGSGKTVLFRALIGTVPHEGTVRWAAGARIGYVPQKLDIERDLPLTGADFLGARASVSREPAGEMARALASVGLDPQVARRPIGALSGGQFQRLLVAFALVGRPNVLLLDEPTAGVDAFIFLAKNRLVIALVSPDIARTAGIDVARLDLLYLPAFALTIALGLRYLGVLLMGSLVIIPAATARRLASDLRGMLAISVAVAVFSTLLGTALAGALHRATGPLIVVTAAGIFFASLARPRPA